MKIRIWLFNINKMNSDRLGLSPFSESFDIRVYLQFYGKFVLKRCIRDVHCPATGAAWGNYSCLTVLQTQFSSFHRFLWHMTTSTHNIIYWFLFLSLRVCYVLKLL